MDPKLAAYLTYGREKTAALPLLSRITGALSRGAQSAARGFAPAPEALNVQALARNPRRVIPPVRGAADKTTVTSTGGAKAPAASEASGGMSPWAMAALGVPVVAGLGYGAYRLADEAKKQQALDTYMKQGADDSKKQLSAGTRVEAKEHGEHFKELAKQVAADHLKEDPAYYTHLKAMEEGKNPFLRERVRGNG
jgi:hypothetical protein